MGQLWEIVSLPDNLPIVFLLVLVPFFLWYGLRQAFANDRLIARLEADPQLAKTHHRKNEPFREGLGIRRSMCGLTCFASSSWPP